MKTILFITDLHTGSRVPELAGVREFAVTHDWHVEEIEVARLERPITEVLKYWRPEGCILEGSSNLLPPVSEFKGIPVRLASGHAAEIVMRGSTVVQARLQFRRFARGEERTEMLPWLQAAAIALDAGSVPALIYADAGDATECMWVIADG